jgi:hypothetical protein
VSGVRLFCSILNCSAFVVVCKKILDSKVTQSVTLNNHIFNDSSFIKGSSIRYSKIELMSYLIVLFSLYLSMLWMCGPFQLRIMSAVPLHATEALGGGGEKRCSSYSFLTSVLDGGWVVSVTPRPRFASGERSPGTHCTGGWVGLRAGLDTEVKGKILCPCWGSNPDLPVVQSVVRHYTD